MRTTSWNGSDTKEATTLLPVVHVQASSPVPAPALAITPVIVAPAGVPHAPHAPTGKPHKDPHARKSYDPSSLPSSAAPAASSAGPSPAAPPPHSNTPKRSRGTHRRNSHDDSPTTQPSSTFISLPASSSSRGSSPTSSFIARVYPHSESTPPVSPHGRAGPGGHSPLL